MNHSHVLFDTCGQVLAGQKYLVLKLALLEVVSTDVIINDVLDVGKSWAINVVNVGGQES